MTGTIPARRILLLFFLALSAACSSHSDDGQLPDSTERFFEEAERYLRDSTQDLDAEAKTGLVPELAHAGKFGPTIVRFRRVIDEVEIWGQQALVVFGRENTPIAQRHNLAPAKVSQPFKDKKERPYWFIREAELIPSFLNYRRATPAEGPGTYGELISTASGEVLAGGSISDEAVYNYRIYDQDDPFGHSQPHPTGIPDGYRPAGAIPQVVRSIEELSVRTNDPWLPPAATGTRGNNVDAFFNSITEADGSCDPDVWDDVGAGAPVFVPSQGDFRAQPSSGGFDFVYSEPASSSDFYQTTSSCPRPDSTDAQLNAKVVQTFYWGNLLHDLFYDAGFDEVSGNAQQNNFGRGGIAGDPLIINPGMSFTLSTTPVDGLSPLLNFGVHRYSASNRDSSLDFSIFGHEWGHYMVRRLVGAGRHFFSYSQGRALNEGWADFIGVMVNVHQPDFSGSMPGATSSYAVGSYDNLDYTTDGTVATSTGVADSYFYGIRRWPYGPSNPFTFRHIENGVLLPAGDFFDWKTRTLNNSEIHNAGEIWAATLWDCAREIFIRRTGRSFQQNREAILDYLVAGMKLTPAEPTYTEARDAFLLAIRSSDSRDYDICRRSFVNRGMGSGAVSPDRGSRSFENLLESFSNDDYAVSVVVAGLDDDIRSIDRDGFLDNTETGLLTIKLRNTGFERIDLLRVVPRISSDFVTVPEVTVSSLMPSDDDTIVLPVTLRHARNYDPTRFDLEWIATGPAGGGRGLLTLYLRTHFDMRSTKGADRAEFAETFDDWRHEDYAASLYLDQTWHRENLGGNTVYAAGERFSAFDQALVSPPVLVGDEFDFRITFDQSYQFQRTLPDGRMLSKGVGYLDLSTDDGRTWTNIMSFSGNLAGFPALRREEIDLGNRYANQMVRVRFRLQSPTASLSDSGVTTFYPVDEHWYLDNIQFWGIFNAPFTGVFDEDGF